ncbi:HPP family protein [Sphingomonas morindae]|uniref:HPP family protein n=1 Tax=Sphingomonas morindae TaxID=1541170 RepID=A0ABY4X6Z8_9SPHN|nr:HPP family protein [Sphingomonas morindae]USI72669.1 HPP family protein [Sphingomonas morindae]
MVLPLSSPPHTPLRTQILTAGAALLGILITAAISRAALGAAAPLWLVAPIGASAVLVFAVPASPLAQPWPVIGGNMLSALVGVAAAKAIAAPVPAAAVAVGGAILAMSLARCLHPPGGAAALTAVIGGPAVHAAGFGFALLPVGLNAALLVLAGMLLNRATGHSYPHRAPHPAAGAPHPEDLDRALADLGETLDVQRDDLDLLFARVAYHAARRHRRPQR